MKKKHRDIVVDGVKYGWTKDGCYHVKLWKDKKVFAEYDIPYHHDGIVPSMIAGLIKDPVGTLAWLNAEPCPFCGTLVQRSQDSRYLICTHEEDCWMYSSLEPTLILKNQTDAWNKRH